MSAEDTQTLDPAAAAARVETPFQRFWSEFRESRIALLALVVLAMSTKVFLSMAVGGGLAVAAFLMFNSGAADPLPVSEASRGDFTRFQ